MLTERQEIKLEILDDGQIQVRTDTVIERDGVEITRLHHRETLEPGQDVSTKHEKIKKASSTFWDTSTVTAFNAKKVARGNPT